MEFPQIALIRVRPFTSAPAYNLVGLCVCVDFVSEFILLLFWGFFIFKMATRTQHIFGFKTKRSETESFVLFLTTSTHDLTVPVLHLSSYYGIAWLLTRT